MTTPLLTDSQGKKIGKTEGNVIAITDSPENLFGKLMSLPDDIIVKGFTYLTRIPMDRLEKIEKALQSGENPIDYKKQLAFAIVEQLSDNASAQAAQEAFESTVQNRELPTDIPTISLDIKDGLIGYIDLLMQTNMATSRGEAKRLIEQGGVEIDNENVTDINGETTIKDEILLKVGKRKFVKVTLK
jgi:tyrosyl-tRNA synthetase